MNYEKPKVLLEHETTPGMIYENVLLYSGVGTNVGGILNEMVDINESNDHSNKIVKFRGKFQEADAVNKNKRSYPFKVLKENVENLMEMIKSGGLSGELDHPTDSIVHLMNISHKVTKLWWEGKILMGEGVILNTPSGKVLRSLMEGGVRIGISSRGVGSGKVNENGILVIGENYKLITFDAVADPSTHQAFQERVVNKNESVINNFQNSKKNEVRSVNSISEELFLAYLQQRISNKTK